MLSARLPSSHEPVLLSESVLEHEDGVVRTLRSRVKLGLTFLVGFSLLPARLSLVPAGLSPPPDESVGGGGVRDPFGRS